MPYLVLYICVLSTLYPAENILYRSHVAMKTEIQLLFLALFTFYTLCCRKQEIMAAQRLKALVLIGSTREGRMADRVTKFMTSQLNKREWDVDIVGE